MITKTHYLEKSEKDSFNDFCEKGMIVETFKNA